MTITKIGEAIHQGRVLGYNLEWGGAETINHGHVLGYSGMR